MSLFDYLEVLRRRALLLAIVLVVTAAGFLIVALREGEGLFEASGQIAINARDPAVSLTDFEIVSRKPSTEVQVFQRDDVRVIAETALGPGFVQTRVSAQAVEGIDGLQVLAKSKEPQDAVRIVTAFMDAYVEFSREQRSMWFLDSEPALLQELEDLQNRIAELSGGEVAQDLSAQLLQLEVEARATRNQLERLRLASTTTNGGVEIVNQAQPLGPPVGPQPLRSLAVGIIVGLFMGIGAAFLREYLDKAVRSPKQIARGVPGLSVISTVGSERGMPSKPVVVERPRSDTADDFRGLRSIIQSLALSRGKRVVQLAGSGPGEGTSEAAANIAILLSQVGTRVLLIDADVQSPTQRVLFGIEPAGDLARVLGGESLEKNCSSIAHNLDMLSFADSASAAADLLSGPAMKRVLDEARSMYDAVIIDSPPLSQSSDSFGLSVFVDAVLLVVGLNVATMPRVHESFTTLRSLDREILGAVVIDRGAQEIAKVAATVR
jgi:Mrp family chromosome partitioning ATPase/capsular polysaccharide biosynthesis protein